MFTMFHKEFLIGFERYQLDLIIFNWHISREVYVDMLSLNLVCDYEKKQLEQVLFTSRNSQLMKIRII